MSYSNPNRRTYSFGEHDFGAGALSLGIKGPKGKAGKLIDIHVASTETFTTTTTDGMVLVGTAADTNAYAQFELGALAATDGASALDESTDPNAILDPVIPADTQVEVTFVAPTGGTPAGKGYVDITIDWDD